MNDRVPVAAKRAPRPPIRKALSDTSKASPKASNNSVPELVAVTGATGFLGAHVVAALAMTGVKIRILTHRQTSHPLWQALPVEIVSGSVLDPVACAQLVAGADAVVHAAGLIKSTRDVGFTIINTEGTATLAQVVRDARPSCRFVLISSLVVREPQLSAYAASKWGGELAAQAAFAGQRERLVVLRPPAIYGPWDRETLALFKAATGKVAPVFGKGRAAFMHVEDAANAIVQVVMGAAPAGNYALTGPDFAAYSVRELVEAAAQAVGGKPRLITVPGSLLQAAGTLWGWQARLRGRPEIFTAGKAREYLHDDWIVRPAESLPFSVFEPAIKLPEGFTRTVDWYKAMAWL
jgi:nucleoside-diphosphate-sugar epimerase